MSDLLSGIGSLAKQFQEQMNTYEIRKITEKVQNMVMNFTEAEQLVRDATNEDPWGPTGPQMKEIAQLTHHYDTYAQVMQVLWKRMFDDNKSAWRRVYKSLMLLNHLLLNGSDRVAHAARDHIYQMRSLESYKCLDEKGKDQGVNIRHRVKIIIDLLQDDDALRAEKQKARGDNKSKYQGYTADDISMGRGGSSRSNDDWGSTSGSSRNQRRDDDWGKDDWNSSSGSGQKQNNFSSGGGGREVNAFSFPGDEEDGGPRRTSESPELGFRETTRSPSNKRSPRNDDEDDGFGAFASSRATPTKTATSPATQQAQTAQIPRIGGPPAAGSLSATGTPVRRVAASNPAALPASQAVAPQEDLFSLNISTAPTAGNPSAAAAKPAPPSAGAQTADLLGFDFGAAPTGGLAAVASTGALPRRPSNGEVDLFSNSTTVSQPQQQQQPQLDIFGDINGSSMSPVTAIAATATVQSPFGSSSGSAPFTADAAFFGGGGDGGATLLQPTLIATPAGASGSQQQASPSQQQKAKVGNTWADSASLFDLDNLTKKTRAGEKAAGPSLNQMMSGKK